MGKLVKKYAIISTSYWDGDNWKNFHVIQSGLSEEDILKIKYNYDEYLRLWNECYDQEKDNSKKGIVKNLRVDLENVLNKRNKENNFTSISDYYKIWSEKDLIIEIFDVE